MNTIDNITLRHKDYFENYYNLRRFINTKDKLKNKKLTLTNDRARARSVQGSFNYKPPLCNHNTIIYFGITLVFVEATSSSIAVYG